MTPPVPVFPEIVNDPSCVAVVLARLVASNVGIRSRRRDEGVAGLRRRDGTAPAVGHAGAVVAAPIRHRVAGQADQRDAASPAFPEIVNGPSCVAVVLARLVASNVGIRSRRRDEGVAGLRRRDGTAPAVGHAGAVVAAPIRHRVAGQADQRDAASPCVPGDREWPQLRRRVLARLVAE